MYFFLAAFQAKGKYNPPCFVIMKAYVILKNSLLAAAIGCALSGCYDPYYDNFSVSGSYSSGGSDNRADYRQGHGLFFQFTEVVGLLLRLLHQAVRLIDDVQPGGSHPHQECELFLRAICRHDKSVLSSSAVAGAIGVTWVRLKRMNPAAAARR